MVIGALIAAYDDLNFSLLGYILIFFGDFFTALRGVYLKHRLEADKKLSKLGLLFYNAFFSLLLLVIYFSCSSEIYEVLSSEAWSRSSFLLYFSLASGLGPLLQYSIFLCTQVNSALTTTVVGCLKNVLTTYLGMLLGDYHFSAFNFFGISLSVAASLVYSYAKFGS